MNPNSHNRLNAWISAFPRIAGGAAILVGSIVLVGWVFHIPLLKSLHPDLVSMKANSAVAFVLAGIAMLLLSASGTGIRRSTVAFLGCLVGLIGVLNVLQYALAWDAGIDQLLFSEAQGTIGTHSPGRMALNTAICFCLLGLALVTMKRRDRWSNVSVQFSALAAGLFGLLVLLAYSYGLSGFTGIAVYAQMALHTAVLFVLLSLGVLCLQPDAGLMAVITAKGSGAYAARRLMLAAVGVPMVIGWLVSAGEMRGLYGNQFGDVIGVTADIAIIMLLVWMIGRSLNKADSERSNWEKTLRESEERWRAVVHSATDAIVTVGENGAIISWNEAAENIFGYSSAVAVGQPVNLIIPERYRDAHRDGMHRFLATGDSRVIGKTVELTGLKSDGSEFPIDLSLAMLKVDDAVMFTGIIRDISERKRVESIISESEKQFKELFDDAPVAYHEMDLEGHIVRVNQTELRLLGYRLEEMLGHFVWDFLDDQEASRQSVLAKLAGTKPPAKSVERVYRRKDLTRIDVVSEDTLLRDAEGCITGIRTTLQDVTELKRGQKLLHESEERYRTLVQNLAEGIALVNDEEQFMFANPAAETLFGVTAGSLVGRSLREFMDLDEFEKMRGLTIKRQKGEITSYELQVTRPDGERRTLLATVSPFIDSDGIFAGALGIFRDLTDRKRGEESLKQSVSLLQATLESTADGILVVDKSGKITSYNRQFAEMWSLPDDVVASRDDDRALNHVLGQLKDPEAFISKVRDLYAHPDESGFDVLEFRDGRVFERYSQAQLIDGKPAGRVWSFRNVTERRQAEQGRELLIEELKSALENVRTLGGLIPICSSCKKIRDDKGYWNQLEKYIVEHTDARLTHGLCPDCAKLYFPGLAAKAS